MKFFISGLFLLVGTIAITILLFFDVGVRPLWGRRMFAIRFFYKR